MSRTTAAVATVLLLVVGCGPASEGEEAVTTGAEESSGVERPATEETDTVPGRPPDVAPGPSPADPVAPDAESAAPGAPGSAGGVRIREGQAEEPATGAAVDPEQATAYMRALADSDDPDAMREGLSLTVEDSTAHTFLRHHAQVAAAYAGAGDPLDPASLEPTEDGFRTCAATTGDCVDLTDFTADDGLLTGFRVDGEDLGERLVAGHGVTASSEGVDAHLLTAYQDVTDDTLVITAEFTTVDDVDLDLPGAVYSSPDGARARVAEAVGAYRLRAGTATEAALFLPLTPVGGKLTIGGCLPECSARIHLEFPVR
ncbi:hypothetical protein [Nocardiopsis sp. MG754419]|uniref:hypothetical protein n=1 Tax=Nocardiopsis sp. MG754419 TaxID=2259865 RepID=UPI001BAB2E9E|nr:hypothetical protein [Nocardiopsis sp. MG754419]MBR8743728.1 hypothetical protein [Nocardiopsis sp. MG754419]